MTLRINSRRHSEASSPRRPGLPGQPRSGDVSDDGLPARHSPRLRGIQYSRALWRRWLGGPRLAHHAKQRGLTHLFWEPMSVGREFGHTHAATEALQARIDAAGLPLPLIPMVDIDHGDVTSP